MIAGSVTEGLRSVQAFSCFAVGAFIWTRIYRKISGRGAGDVVKTNGSELSAKFSQQR